MDKIKDHRFGVDKERDRKIYSSLKGTGSAKRKWSQQRRRTAEKAERGEGSVDELTKMIIDPQASARNILRMINAVGKMDLTPLQRIALIKVSISFHKMIFGTKVITSSEFNIEELTNRVIEEMTKHSHTGDETNE